MKKKSIIARVGVMAAAVTLATTSLMSGTLAKYTTTINGVATAVVAKWSPTVKMGTSSQNPTTKVFEINLNQGIKKEETAGTIAAVSNNGTDYKLAPGVSGSIPITIDMGYGADGNGSTGPDVDTVYQVSIQPHDASSEGGVNAALMASRIPLNMKFSVGAKEVNIENGNEIILAKGVIPNTSKAQTENTAVGTKKTPKVELKFNWPFEDSSDPDGNNATDTNYLLEKDDGTPAANPTAEDIKLDIIVKVWQANSDEVYTSVNQGNLLSAGS